MNRAEANFAVATAVLPSFRCSVAKLSEREADNAVADAVRSEQGKDKFLPFELELAAMLFMLWRNALDDSNVFNDLNAAMLAQSPTELTEALTAGASKLGSTFSEDDGDDEEADRIIDASLVAGAAILGLQDRVGGMNSVFSYETGAVRQVEFTTNNYLQRIVAPALEKALQSQRSNPRPDDAWAGVVKDLLVRLLVNNAAYWRIVANQTTGKAHHYGILRSSLERGVLGYQLVAVLDQRTSDICWELHGRQFLVADAVDHLERGVTTRVDDLPRVSPWASVADVKGKTSPDLVIMGVLVPPFHPSCRTTLKPLFA